MNTLYRRVKNEAGKWRYEAVNIGRGRRPEGLDGSRFFTRIKKEGDRWQSWVPLDGNTLDEAIESAERIDKGLAAKGAGFKVEGLDDIAIADRLSTKIGVYCDETKANKAPATWRMYRESLEYFQESCKKVRASDVAREDMLHFKTYLAN